MGRACAFSPGSPKKSRYAQASTATRGGEENRLSVLGLVYSRVVALRGLYFQETSIFVSGSISVESYRNSRTGQTGSPPAVKLFLAGAGVD